MSIENKGSLQIGDASVYQSHLVDWERVRDTSDVIAWWLKLGGADWNDTPYVDPTWLRNRAECLRLEYINGPYYFVNPVVDWQKQLDAISKNYSPHGMDLGVALDFEKETPMEVSAMQDYVLNAMSTTRTRFGVLPTFYSGIPWIEKYMIDAAHPWPAEMNVYPIWIAQYPWLRGHHTKEEALALSANWQPEMPAGVPNWTIWQFSCTNIIDGISPAARLDVDMSVFLGGDLTTFRDYVWSLGTHAQDTYELPYDNRVQDGGAHESDPLGEFARNQNPKPLYTARVANPFGTQLNGRSLINPLEIYGFYINGTTVDVWMETVDETFAPYEKRAVITRPDAEIQISVALEISGKPTLERLT